MVSESEIKKSKEIGEKAWKRLMDESLGPTPESYSLFYHYYAGTDYAVNQAVDKAMKKDGGLSEKQCAELYRDFIQDTAATEFMLQAEETILSIMQEVSGIVGEAESATGEYGKSLAQSNKELGDVKSIEDLKKVVTAMASDTKKMREKNSNLEIELATTSQRMESLRVEVETAKEEAKTDGLTKLINRKAFDATLKDHIKKSVDDNTAISLLMLDIDYFKKFNDTYGHQVGDQVLKLVARTLVEGIKGKDIAARYGGEEFSVILPETNLTGAVMVGNALRKAIANKELVNKNTGDTLGHVTISVGAAEALRNEKIESLVERADKALYAAKGKGRDQVCAAPKSEE
ncbi:MAG: GGDEF domain-containing protein [Micavibrio sp.]|nr:GGDEF domain-containing protein [Micavibrio sp.]HCK33467.1 GGDEF domain-containing protein [Rhodospirillaceae bacterium]